MNPGLMLSVRSSNSALAARVTLAAKAECKAEHAAVQSRLAVLV